MNLGNLAVGNYLNLDIKCKGFEQDGQVSLIIPNCDARNLSRVIIHINKDIKAKENTFIFKFESVIVPNVSIIENCTFELHGENSRSIIYS